MIEARNLFKGVLKFFLVIVFLFSGCQKEDSPEPAPPYNPIDLDLFGANLRGFNLQGKFDTFWSNNGFKEEDFIMISGLGFNFARLPLDYLTYTQWGNWNVFVESEVAEIDRAVEWGKEYGVHICINLHRAPGYSVNVSDQIPANQKLNLWTDAAAQDAFVKHWEYFADRYRDVPVGELSFNLINEPANVDESTYVTIMRKAIDRIHDINPNRVVFVDGLNYANDLIPTLKNVTNVIQAIHAYEPFTLTHYKASWVDGSDSWPVPVWPMIDISGYLYGSLKPEYKSSLILEGNFLKDSEIVINVKQVSIESTLEIRSDDQVIYTKHFVCGPDLGEDWTEINLTQWGYQNFSNKDYTVVLPADGSSLTISNTEGDWMTYNQITIHSASNDFTFIPGDNSWGSKQDTYLIDSEGNITDTNGNSLILRELHEKLQMAEDENIPVMIQEFGVHNQTPHSVTLAFLGDLVPVFREYNLGYALWNLEGSFGIINSGRTDCNYESYEGELLDREMMDILKNP